MKITIYGIVVKGFGEGSYYVRLYSGLFQKYLGITPYPGTLNIYVNTDLSRILPLDKALVIPPPRNDLGEVYVFKALLNNYPVYVIRPSKTRHDWRIVEVVSDRYLRDLLGLRDGDRVKLTILI
ncbi:MAG: DUF120 domain-containing protein [Thermoprotei archaeon]